MRIAVLSDIHANREALDAVLETVERLAPDEIVLLGDLVGYGPDPAYVVEEAAGLIARGALCVQGNHDEAVARGSRGMTPAAREAVDWTRGRLASDEIAFLAGLPLQAASGDRLYVHASAHAPARWPYITDADAAGLCLAATQARLVVCGHTHLPALFYAPPGRRPVAFRPPDGEPAPLSALCRHVVVAGSVGQPRDGNPAACLALIDTDAATVTMVRVPYDHEETARKIVAAGLPEWLGHRLALGQ